MPSSSIPLPPCLPALHPCICQFGSYNKVSQTGWLKQKIFISPSFGGWEAQDQGVVVLLLGEGSLPDVQMAIFSLCPTWQKERGSTLSFCLFL